MTFKIGDKVRVKDNLDKISGFHGGYMEEMDDLIGKVVTIDTIDGDDVFLKEDPHGYVWDKRAFEPAVMTKQDIEDGDIVTLRNGDKLYYELESDTFHDINAGNNNLVTDMNDFNDDMTSDLDDDNYDIIKVERVIKYETIYERNNTIKEMTLREVCDALGYEVKIIKEEE